VEVKGLAVDYLLGWPSYLLTCSHRVASVLRCRCSLAMAADARSLRRTRSCLRSLRESTARHHRTGPQESGYLLSERDNKRPIWWWRLAWKTKSSCRTVWGMPGRVWRI